LNFLGLIGNGISGEATAKLKSSARSSLQISV